MNRFFRRFAISGLLGLLIPASFASNDDHCQTPFPTKEVPVSVRSGDVRHSGVRDEREVVFSRVIRVQNTNWVRLKFDEVKLGGDRGSGNASYLRITSLRDGAFQFHTADTLEQWQNTSAYFNGNAVRVEIIAYPGTGDNSLEISEVMAGITFGIELTSICDGVDLRQLSNDPRSARLSSGCTAWMFDDLNSMFGTAGHCGVSGTTVVQFNVPLSSSSGSLNHPPPEHQYPVDAASRQSQNGGVGNDWAYFGTFPNSNTGLTPFQAQAGGRYTLAASAPNVSGQTIRITGYGTVSSPVSPTWNQVQKTHAGPYFQMTGTTVRYRTDTTGGNSGSAVQNETAGNIIIGVHTHGGCTSTGGSNAGTAAHHTGWRNALNNPLSICRSGGDPVARPLFASGDLNNNFGTLNTASGRFGKLSEIPAQMHGLAFNRNLRVFYGVDRSRRLVTVNPVTGVATIGATISGTTQTLNGLAHDPVRNRLYGISQANGQLFLINPTTAAATTIGPAWGGSVGALDFDSDRDVLFGIDDSGSVSKLVRISTTEGSQTVIGNLGAGIGSCKGLAFNDRDGMLYTVNTANRQLLRINPATGVASSLGDSFGMFGVNYGMATELYVATQAVPTTATIQFGTLMSGNVGSIGASNNNYLSVLQTSMRTRSEPAVRVLVEGTAASATPAKLQFLLEAHATANPASGAQQSIELFDFQSNSWVQVDSRPATSSDSVVVATAPGVASRFVEPGTLRVRARLNWHDWPTITNRDWRANIDQAVWISLSP
jgi:V8-like Glu-specific endopeptidase